MSKTSFQSPWHLLATELIELATRKRTYAVRVAYAGILFLIFWVVYKEMVWNHYDARAGVLMLGAGDELFNSMITIDFSAIYLMFVVTELELSSFISTDGDPLFLLIGVIHFVWHCGVLLVLRSICLGRSEGYIGRAFHN